MIGGDEETEFPTTMTVRERDGTAGRVGGDEALGFRHQRGRRRRENKYDEMRERANRIIHFIFIFQFFLLTRHRLIIL